MKVFPVKKSIKRFATALCLSFCAQLILAQDTSANMNAKVSEESATWYTQPWVWVLGGALFLLLLTALLRGGGNKD